MELSARVFSKVWKHALNQPKDDMQTLKALFDSNREWAERIEREQPGFFEKLSKQQAQMRELLSNYEVGGDSTLVFYDRKSAYSGSPLSGMGIKETFSVLSKIRANRNSTNSTRDIKEFRGSFYLLTQAEANNNGIFLSKDKTINIWSEGIDSISTVVSDGNYKPGDITEFNVKINDKLVGYEGSRILLLQNGHLVGIGVIAKIHR